MPRTRPSSPWNFRLRSASASALVLCFVADALRCCSRRSWDTSFVRRPGVRFLGAPGGVISLCPLGFIERPDVLAYVPAKPLVADAGERLSSVPINHLEGPARGDERSHLVNLGEERDAASAPFPLLRLWVLTPHSPASTDRAPVRKSIADDLCGRPGRSRSPLARRRAALGYYLNKTMRGLAERREMTPVGRNVVPPKVDRMSVMWIAPVGLVDKFDQNSKDRPRRRLCSGPGRRRWPDARARRQGRGLPSVRRECELGGRDGRTLVRSGSVFDVDTSSAARHSAQEPSRTGGASRPVGISRLSGRRGCQDPMRQEKPGLRGGGTDAHLNLEPSGFGAETR